MQHFCLLSLQLKSGSGAYPSAHSVSHLPPAFDSQLLIFSGTFFMLLLNITTKTTSTTSAITAMTIVFIDMLWPFLFFFGLDILLVMILFVVIVISVAMLW
jgi:hypothetical protein